MTQTPRQHPSTERGLRVSTAIVTATDATVDPARETELVDGYRQMIESGQPDGLLRSELLRGQNGVWRIQTTWRDMAALQAVRASGKPPAALALLDGLGAEHTHDWFTVADGFTAV
jgi:quinol monooxygenase YgiN